MLKSTSKGLHRIDLNLLPVLEQLLLTQSVTETARVLSMSAPTVSRTLAQLRKAFHDQLLVRSGRHLVKTPRAEAMQAELRTLLSLAESLTPRQQPESMQSCQRIFRVRCDGTLAGVISRILLPRIQNEAPEVGFQFVGESPSGDFRADNIDIEVSGRRGFPPETIVKKLGEVALVGLVAHGHPLEHEIMSETKLLTYPHVLAAIQTEFEQEVNAILNQFDVQRSRQFIVPSFFSAALTARESNAVATMPATIAFQLKQSLDMTMIDLPTSLPQVEVLAAWHVKYRDDYEHQWFRQHITACMSEIVSASLVS